MDGIIGKDVMDFGKGIDERMDGDEVRIKAKGWTVGGVIGPELMSSRKMQENNVNIYIYIYTYLFI